MGITVIAVGKLKEAYWEAAAAEYAKRIGAYIRLNMIAVPDEKYRGTLSPADEALVKLREGGRMLSQVDSKDFVIALDMNGTRLTSEALASLLQASLARGVPGITFLIGGSLGLSPEALARADFRLSFSSLTFPNQLMRPLLLEQIYRAFKIMRGEPYHR